jgi:SAM-dependent methyltransferase
VTPEFDRYSARYQTLLQDPLRDAFAGDSAYFVRRKAEVIDAFAAARGLDLQRATWLDVGCGTGDLLRAAGRSFGRAIGCDVSHGMLDESRGVEVVPQDDPARLPFEPTSVDWVSAVCVFHHVEPPVRAGLAREMVRVTRPGGIVMVMEHNPFNPVVQVIVRRTPVDAAAILLRASATRRLLAAAGLDVLETRYFLNVPARLSKALSWLETGLAHLPIGGQYAVFARRPAAGLP